MTKPESYGNKELGPKLTKGFRVSPTLPFARRLLNITQLLIYERSLAEPIPTIKTKGEIEVRFLCSNEVGKLAKDINLRREKKWKKRIEDGHFCIIAEAQKTGKMIGFGWIIFQRLYVSERTKKFGFDKRAAWLYDDYVLPLYRGRRIHAKIIERRLIFLRERGCKKTYITVNADNISSKKNIERLGFRIQKMTSLLRLLDFSLLIEGFRLLPEFRFRF